MPSTSTTGRRTWRSWANSWAFPSAPSSLVWPLVWQHQRCVFVSLSLCVCVRIYVFVYVRVCVCLCRFPVPLCRCLTSSPFFFPAPQLCRHSGLKKYPHKEIIVLFLFAYTGYAGAEAIQLSGIMSLFFCGIVLSHYNWHNLSDASKVSTHHIFKGFAMTTETIVFAYMGMSLFSGQFNKWSVTFVVLAIAACLLGRVLNIVPLRCVVVVVLFVFVAVVVAVLRLLLLLL